MTASNRTATPKPPKVSQRRQARLQAREQQRQRSRRRRTTRWALWAAIAIVAVAGVGFLLARNVSGQPGRAMAIQGQQHIDKGQQHVAYNSKPPTSGPHWNILGEAPVAWGIYKEPIVEEGQIHNLEHGGIMIQYNCRDCPELVAQLEDFYNRFTAANKLPLFQNSTKIVVAPYYDMPNRIALTAWGRIDTFNDYDEDRITRFVQAFRDKGPEAAP
jgi:hypothetical protein